MAEEIKKDDYGKILLSWVFPEYIKHQRTAGWYAGAVVLVAGLLLYAVWTSNFLFAVMIVVVFMTIIFHNFGEPDELECIIFEDGVRIGSKYHLWSDIKRFWIIYQPPEVKTLYFNFKGLAPTVSVDLCDQNPVGVREVLLKYLKEDLGHDRELAGDELSRWLKI
jgi:hypothetical protein